MKNFFSNFRFIRFVNLVIFTLIVFSFSFGILITKLALDFKDDIQLTVNQEKQLNFSKDIIWLDEVLTQSMRSYIYSHNQKWLDRYISHAALLDSTILKAKVNVTNPEILEVFVRQGKINAQLVALESRCVDLVKQDSAAVAIELLEGIDYQKLQREYKKNIDNYIHLSGARGGIIARLLAIVLNKIDWAISLAWIIVVFSTIFVFIVFNIIKRIIVSPLAQARKITKRIGAGDLSLDANGLRSKNEIGQLLVDLDTMVLTLRKSIGYIRTASDHLFAASSEVSNGSHEIAEGANSQAGSAEEVTASIEEMLFSVEQNAVDAKDTLKTAELAEQGILKGRESFEHTSNALKEIADGISVISEIANKTDMLALNAAVEAARAGHEGKGFAVVAAEVRKLAELTRRSADGITKLVRNNVEAAIESGVMLESVLPSVSKTTLLLQKIVRSSDEQTSGLEEISNAILQFNASIQQNMVVAEELSASSEELSVQARSLKDSVSFFSLDSSETEKKVASIQLEMQKLQETLNAFSEESELSKNKKTS